MAVLASAKDFTLLVGASDQVRLEERASEYLITYSRDASAGEADGVVKIALTLSRADLRATISIYLAPGQRSA